MKPIDAMLAELERRGWSSHCSKRETARDDLRRALAAYFEAGGLVDGLRRVVKWFDERDRSNEAETVGEAVEVLEVEVDSDMPIIALCRALRGYPFDTTPDEC